MLQWVKEHRDLCITLGALIVVAAVIAAINWTCPN